MSVTKSPLDLLGTGIDLVTFTAAYISYKPKKSSSRIDKCQPILGCSPVSSSVLMHHPTNDGSLPWTFRELYLINRMPQQTDLDQGQGHGESPPWNIPVVSTGELAAAAYAPRPLVIPYTLSEASPTTPDSAVGVTVADANPNIDLEVEAHPIMLMAMANESSTI